MRWLMLLVAWGCAPDPTPSPAPGVARRALPPETDLTGAPGQHGAASVAGSRRVWAWREPDARSTELRAADGDEVRTLVAHGNPDRPAIHPEGSPVAFVSGASGIASVWIVAFEGGEPVQLTNVGLRTGAGRGPVGFVPPPHDDSLRFDGDWLRWSSPEGDQAVRWR